MIASASPVHFVSLFFLPRLSSLTHFTSQGLPIAYPNPILPALFFLLFLHFGFHVVSHHSDRYSICVCAIETMPIHKSETKENISTIQLDNSQVYLVSDFPSFFVIFLTIFSWWIFWEERKLLRKFVSIIPQTLVLFRFFDAQHYIHGFPVSRVHVGQFSWTGISASVHKFCLYDILYDAHMRVFRNMWKSIKFERHTHTEKTPKCEEMSKKSLWK